MEQKQEKSNFLQVGDQIECSNCHPEKNYADYHLKTLCNCICHKKVTQSNGMLSKEHYPDMGADLIPSFTSKKMEDNWEDAFEHYFPDPTGRYLYPSQMKHIKMFIRTHRDMWIEQAQAKKVKEIREWVENLKIPPVLTEYQKGYNQALQDILSKLVE